MVFLNKVVRILHECADRWSGSANKNEGERFLITWKLPEIEESENEKNEMLLEQRTEYADKSIIAAVKIVSELRRSPDMKAYAGNAKLLAKLGKDFTEPYMTFAIHMGWTIEGAIGSDFKIDACYMSPHLQIAYRIETLCAYYEMQILVTESCYNLMSLKARNTLRKIDVIAMKECKEAMGIYTFDLSRDNKEIQGGIPDDH